MYFPFLFPSEVPADSDASDTDKGSLAAGAAHAHNINIINVKMIVNVFFIDPTPVFIFRLSIKSIKVRQAALRTF